MKRNLLWLLPPLAVIVLMMALAFQPTREEQARELFVRDRAALEEMAQQVLKGETVLPPKPWKNVVLYDRSIRTVEFELGSAGFGSETSYWGINYVPSNSHMVGFQGQQWDYWKAHKNGRLYYDPEGDNTCYVVRLDECWYYYEMKF